MKVQRSTNYATDRSAPFEQDEPLKCHKRGIFLRLVVVVLIVNANKCEQQNIIKKMSYIFGLKRLKETESLLTNPFLVS
jgi:hypothetical protein